MTSTKSIWRSWKTTRKILVQYSAVSSLPTPTKRLDYWVCMLYYCIPVIFISSDKRSSLYSWIRNEQAQLYVGSVFYSVNSVGIEKLMLLVILLSYPFSWKTYLINCHILLPNFLSPIDKTKLSNEFTPDDFSTHKNTLNLLDGTLEPEVYIDLNFDYLRESYRQTSIPASQANKLAKQSWGKKDINQRFNLIYFFSIYYS